jgi:hypothetical protein
MGRIFNQIKDIFDNDPDLAYQEATSGKFKESIQHCKIEIGKKLLALKAAVTSSEFLDILEHIGETADEAQKAMDLAANAEQAL